jgi:hypothetical protein
MDQDCRICIGSMVPDGSVETVPDRQSAINGQLFEQSGAGAFSGQHGMPSGIAISESVAETSMLAEGMAPGCAAAGRASGATTSPNTATRQSSREIAISSFTTRQLSQEAHERKHRHGIRYVHAVVS